MFVITIIICYYMVKSVSGGEIDMDRKTCNVILQKILDESPRPMHKIWIPGNGLESHFGLPENDVRSALSRLNDDGLISVKRISDCTLILPKERAFGYFEEQKEEEELKKKEVTDSHRWDIWKQIISFGLGLISGIFLMLLKQWLF